MGEPRSILAPSEANPLLLTYERASCHQRLPEGRTTVILEDIMSTRQAVCTDGSQSLTG